MLFASACAAVSSLQPPASGAEGLVGKASWYGSHHHGQRTASGQLFDMQTMVAAHRSLPFGTLVRVTNLDNGRIAVVRVVDRGPYVRDRVIDVSYAAAKALHMVERGVVRVRLEVLTATE